MQNQGRERQEMNIDPREQKHYQYNYAEGNYRREKPRVGIGPIVIVIAFLILGIIGTAFWGLTALRQTASLPTHTFKVAGHTRLIVSNTAGKIHIHPGQSDSIVVNGTKYARGFGNNINDIQVNYQQQGDTVSVTSDESWSFMSEHGVNLDIAVPNTTDLKVEDTAGDIKIEQVNGIIEAQTRSGEVEASNLNGTLNLSSTSGDVHLDQASGTMTLSTVSGSIEAKQIQLQGQSHLKSTSGDIKFQGTLDPRGSYRMESVSGGINLTLPSDSAFKLDASTTSGEVHNEFDATTVGSAPQPALTLHTNSGDIKVNKQ